jgi:hypothetical protein
MILCLNIIGVVFAAETQLPADVGTQPRGMGIGLAEAFLFYDVETTYLVKKEVMITEPTILGPDGRMIPTGSEPVRELHLEKPLYTIETAGQAALLTFRVSNVISSRCPLIYDEKQEASDLRQFYSGVRTLKNFVTDEKFGPFGEQGYVSNVFWLHNWDDMTLVDGTLNPEKMNQFGFIPDHVFTDGVSELIRGGDYKFYNWRR